MKNGNLRKHVFGHKSWGNYHWQLVPSVYTDTRERKRHSFTIHGGAEPGSAGCIDLTSGDTKFKKYLDSLNMNVICVYAQYPNPEIVVEDKKRMTPNFMLPAFIEDNIMP